MHRSIAFLGLLLVAVSAAPCSPAPGGGCGGGSGATYSSRADYPTTGGNIPTILTQNGLTTLVDLVVKAGLADALSGAGPFTVFAPTNEAFGKVDPATLDAIGKDINLLKKVLTYHVVGSAINPADIKNELTPKTLEGDNLRINVYGNTVTINGALRANTLKATNGIIYVIDKVIIPSEAGSDIAKVLEKKGGFSTLLTAIKVAGLTDTIKSTGPFTLFAPTDDAFKALPAGALDNLIANPEQLKKVLLDHVVSGTVYSRGLPPSAAVKVVGGDAVQVNVSTRGVFVNKAQVTVPDIYASNGVIHVVNSVILP